MSNTLTYKNYIVTVNFSEEDGVFSERLLVKNYVSKVAKIYKIYRKERTEYEF